MLPAALSFVEVALLLFWVAAAASALQLFAPARQRLLAALGGWAALSSFFALGAAFVALDFSSSLVASHAHSSAPLLYRITALWGNHEGSLLLWLVVLWVYAVWLSRSGAFPEPLKQRAGQILAGIITAFNVYTLALSSPFARLNPPPLDGEGLNPLLQDPALAAHPPMLYIGYVGFAAVYALVLAYCFLPQSVPFKAFAQRLRPFVLIPWAFLTVGIGLGSFWAYYELGWGGFWFWDPVENASLLPWLLATALLHSLVASAVRGAFTRWTLLLGLSCFCASTLGLFLVRSGVITSVHAFAVDPARGMAILAILAALLVLALFGLGRFLKAMPATPDPLPFSLRTSALAANNYGLSAVFVIVLAGTVYPMLLASFGAEPVTVGAPYYNAAAVPWLVGLLAVMAFAPFSAWDSTPKERLQRLSERTLALSLALLLLVIALAEKIDALSCALVLAALLPIAGVCVHAYGAPRTARQWGMWLAHAGAGVSALAIVAAVSWQSEKVVALIPGQSVILNGNSLELKSIMPLATPAYVAQRAQFHLYDREKNLIGTLSAEQRLYSHGGMNSTSEVGLLTNAFGDYYIALGERRAGMMAVPLHATYHPLQPWLWLGVLLMGGGGLAAALRQLRKAR